MVGNDKPKLTRAALETLARIEAAGLRLWIPGEFAQARLGDVNFSAVNVAVVKVLLRDGFLEDTGETLGISAQGNLTLASNPEVCGRARQFYADEQLLADVGLRSARHKPDFKRPSGGPTA